MTTNIKKDSIETIKKEFDKRVDELENSDYENTVPVEFGYRYLDDAEENIVTVTDWGNIRKFIEQALSSQEKRLIGEMREKSMETYDLIDKIDNTIEDVWFDHLEGHSCIGDFRSNAYDHPIQYIAFTNCRVGDDDPFEGIGWTPNEALKHLLSLLDSSKK